MAVPGINSWNASLVGYIQKTDWDFDNGGVILFSDGTIWSYEGESPAGGDQLSNEFPFVGFCISERKPGSDVWERLTPDVWGTPWEANPPGYPKWPSEFITNAEQLDPLLSDFSGPLDVAAIGEATSGWVHVQDGDDVWFYPRFGGGERLGIVKVDRITRRWDRYVTTVALENIWVQIQSNVEIYNGYFWFLSRPELATNVRGARLIRVPLEDPGTFDIMHEWSYPDSFWDGRTTTIITSNLSFPDYIDNQYMGADIELGLVIDDGYAYVIEEGVLYDTRTTPSNRFSAGSGDVNYDMSYSYLRRFRIGDYELETLYWHTTPQGWVGYDDNDTWYDRTLGITSQPDGSRTGDNDYNAVGMGFYSEGQHGTYIRDGWIYWIDWGGRNFGAFGAYGMICRLQLSKLTPGTPIQHAISNPLFEIIANGTLPEEGNVGHWNFGAGTFIWMRGGADALLPHMDSSFSFDDEGNIWYKGMAFPPYNVEEYPGYGTRCIYKLTPNDTSVTDVTVTFVGDELKGYSNVRQVPARSGVIEVELSS